MLLSFLIVLGIIISSVPLAAQPDRMQVAASHSILADVVQHVAGDQADITLLMPAGADPHSFQPTPRDLTAIAEAQLVFVNGARLEEQLLEAIKNAADDDSIIEASACVEIIAIGSSAPTEDDEDHEDGEDHEHDEDHEDGEDHEHDEDHEDGEDHEHEMEASADCEQHDRELAMLLDEDHAHDDNAVLGRLEAIDCGGDQHDEDADGEDAHDRHDHGVCDPHVWMNPRNVMYWTLMIRDRLSEADPANAAAYAASAAAYLNELLALSEEFIEPALDALPPQRRILITSHDSLGYLAASYDFEIISTVIPGASTLSEPSARHVAALIDLIKAEDVPAIFGETTVSDNVMQTIARETAAELVVLYSGTLSDSGGPAATYLDYMRYNLTAIIDALSVDE